MSDPMFDLLFAYVNFLVGLWLGGRLQADWFLRHPDEYFRASVRRKAKHGQR